MHRYLLSITFILTSFSALSPVLTGQEPTGDGTTWLYETIMMHGNEAPASKGYAGNPSKADRDGLIKYLDSL